MKIIPDSYEPASAPDAWREYLAAHPELTGDRDALFVIFRAGHRRGFAQGALVSASTVVHVRESGGFDND